MSLLASFSRRAAQVGSFAGALALLGACSVLAGSSAPQCRTDQDCTALAPSATGLACVEGVCRTSVVSVDGGSDAAAFASGPWVCVGRQDPVQSTTYDMKVGVTDARSQDGSEALDPIDGAEISLCTVLDPSCTQPRATARSDSTGFGRIDINSTFNGFLQVKKDGYMPSLIFWGVRMLPTTAQDYMNVPLLLNALGPVYAQLAGVSHEPGTGIVTTGVLDCAYDGKALAAGVQLVLEPMAGNAQVFYMNEQYFPDAKLTETVRGSGGFFNVPPGRYTFSAKIASSGIEVARRDILVGADTFVQAVLEPK